MSFQHPLFLVLVLLLPIFWFKRGQTLVPYSSLSRLPDDTLSSVIDYGVKLVVIALATSLILASASPYLKEQWVEREGTGAHIVLLLDRSSSMNENFTGRRLGAKSSESKSAMARKLLHEFVQRREHDLFAMVSFAGAPIYVLPLTEDHEAVLSAIDASGSRGHGITNMAPGLAMGLDFFTGKPFTGSRIILLVSDGAARIDEETREKIRQWFQETRVSLYWIYLRNPTSARLSEKPDNPNESTTPEYFLNQYFNSLEVPYRAFEAENPDAMERAIQEVEKLENQPLLYREKVPRRDLTDFFLGLSAVLSLLLALIKRYEVTVWTV